MNAALVSLVAWRFGARRGEAVAAGAMFVVFPGLSEAVVWASGVQDVLMTTLVLTSVALATAERPRVVPAALASAAALLVKETAIVVPVLSALVILARGGLPGVRRYRSALLSLAAISLIYLLARVAAGVPSSFLEITDWRYFIKQLIANSFGTVGAPWTDDWGRTHAGLALMRAVSILALAAAAFSRWRRDDATFRGVAACAVWVLAGVLPAFSLFYVGPQLEGARYVYLPAAGFTILLALLDRTRGQSRRRSGAAGRDRPDDGGAGRAVPPGDRERSPAVGSRGGRARRTSSQESPIKCARAGCTSSPLKRKRTACRRRVCLPPRACGGAAACPRRRPLFRAASS